MIHGGEDQKINQTGQANDRRHSAGLEMDDEVTSQQNTGKPMKAESEEPTGRSTWTTWEATERHD